MHPVPLRVEAQGSIWAALKPSVGLGAIRPRRCVRIDPGRFARFTVGLAFMKARSRLQVRQDRPSLESAYALASAAERATIEGVFGRIKDQAIPIGDDPDAVEPRSWISPSEKGALRRNSEEVLQRLLSIAGGEASRFYAAVLIDEVDPILGLRAVQSLLDSPDPIILAGALDHLASRTSQAGDLGEGDAGQVLGLLGHPDRSVATGAVYALASLLGPAGAAEHLLRYVDDPFLGRAVRVVLADEGRRGEILDRAIEALRARGADEPDHGNFFLIERFARDSPEPQLASRARAFLASFRDDTRLTPSYRALVDGMLRLLEHRDAVRAGQDAGLEKASVVIGRLVATGLIDAEQGQRAIARLRDPGDVDPSRGVRAAFEAAGMLVGFDLENKGLDFPPPFDELIRELAAASRGAFAPEAISQVQAPGEDDYTVQFVHRDRLYIARSGWYDANVAVTAVNVALIDAGDPRRFVPLSSGNRRDEWVFAEPGKLRASGVLTPGSGADPDLSGDPSGQRSRAELRDLLPDASPGLSDAEFARAAGESDRTALHRAAERGRVDQIEALIAAGADVEATSEGGSTALHAAALAGLLEPIELLIAAGADVNAPNAEGWTPLHLAAREDGDVPGASPLASRTHGRAATSTPPRGTAYRGPGAENTAGASAAATP